MKGADRWINLLLTNSFHMLYVRPEYLTKSKCWWRQCRQWMWKERFEGLLHSIGNRNYWLVWISKNFILWPVQLVAPPDEHVTIIVESNVQYFRQSFLSCLLEISLTSLMNCRKKIGQKHASSPLVVAPRQKLLAYKWGTNWAELQYTYMSSSALQLYNSWWIQESNV